MIVSDARHSELCQFCEEKIHFPPKAAPKVAAIVTDHNRYAHLYCLQQEESKTPMQDSIALVYNVKDLKTLLEHLPDDMSVIKVEKDGKRTTPTFAVEVGDRALNLILEIR